MDLRYRTGLPAIDALLQSLVVALDEAFPGRVLGSYLIGSYADGSAVATSDLDLAAVFRGDLREDEERRAEELATRLAAGALPVDLDVLGAAPLLAGYLPLATVRLRTGSQLLYGLDVRENLLLPPMEDYRRVVTQGPYVNFVGMIRYQERIAYPLDYPEPDGEFFGYDAARLGNWYSPDGRGLKDLVAGVGWAATALVALRTGRYVGGKGAALRAYRAEIADEWAALLAEVYDLCRARWAYLVPEAPAERARLRELCRRVLPFENHYLSVYRDYLLAELRGDERAGWLFAAQRFGEVLYRDGEVAAALRERARSADPEVRQAIAETLRRIREADV